MNSRNEDQAEWLHSPVKESERRLQPMRDLTLRPFHGPKRRIRLFRVSVVIGSAEGCDIRIEDPFVSPRHAELRLGPCREGYVVHDLSSRNGVFLNGVRVDCAPLPHHGTLRFGRSMLTWHPPELEEEIDDPNWIVADPSMRAVLQSLKKVARSPLPVLLLGETGTGKDMLARLVHRWSQKESGPFVPVNGALTGGTLAESELFGHRKGAFTGADTHRMGALRSAHGGTLFLDEIADVPAPTQVKLLRSLETGEVKALGSDVAEKAEFRLVTATSRNMGKRIQEGGFRLDLYYRIAGVVIHVPPLRERPLDITAIARRLVAARGLDLDAEAESRLLAYRWPGNVRELRSTVERATVLALAEGAPRVLREHLQGLESTMAVTPGISEGHPITLAEHERRVVQWALERNEWSRVATARELGIARSSLLGKMKRFGLHHQRSAGTTA